MEGISLCRLDLEKYLNGQLIVNKRNNRLDCILGILTRYLKKI